MKFLTAPCVHICPANYFRWRLSKRWTKTRFLGDLAAFSIAYKLLPVTSLSQGRLKRNSDGESEVKDVQSDSSWKDSLYSSWELMSVYANSILWKHLKRKFGGD